MRELHYIHIAFTITYLGKLFAFSALTSGRASSL